MLELTGIRIPLDHLDGTFPTEEEAIQKAVLRKLHLPLNDIDQIVLRKRSLDARKKSDVRYNYTLLVTLCGGAEAERELLHRLRRHHELRGVREYSETTYRFPAHLGTMPAKRPVVVGAGCAGLFCALALAEAGLEPLLVERGEDAEARCERIDHFEETGELDPESNIQFGLGGAGTFSDGKLGTGTKSPAHRLILKTFVDAGADPKIMWDAKPHVGSDVLPTVVTNICGRIGVLGGEVRFGTRLTGISTSGGSVSGVTLERRDPQTGIVVEERVPADNVVLACGHSARDVFAMARDRGVALERKPFAMGARIEHAQSAVDRAQYGRAAGHPSLPPAEYKLSWHDASGRGVYTFCMCPGGTVVAAASEPGGVVTNGMSERLRDGRNANAALLVNVLPQDLPGDDVLAGVDLQRRCERAAFERGGGGFAAPAQLVGDFLAGTPSSGPGSVAPTYGRGVTWGSLDGTLPPYVVDAMRAGIAPMARRLRGFDAADAVLTGVESRSSSPVRMTRGGDRQSVSTPGLYPCGEGAGYAGGIMSAATDGLATARAVADALRG